MDVNPYLNFPGNCEEAFEFYKAALGGEMSISRFSEIPADAGFPPVDGNLVMHVSLDLGNGHILMGSDVPAAMGTVEMGNYANVSVMPDSAEQSKKIFDHLADGGQITMPFERQFWGDDFGSLIDRYGVSWMVIYNPQQDA